MSISPGGKRIQDKDKDKEIKTVPSIGNPATAEGKV